MHFSVPPSESVGATVKLISFFLNKSNKNRAAMANELAVWIVLLGAGCHAASKNQAFWRLLTLNQFSLVTGTGLTAAAVCVCVP